jgi:hypothetical protein
MTEQDLRSRLGAYGKAWETNDPAAAKRLFGERATYREVPFDDPMIGREAIERYWKENTDIQKDVKFTYEIIALTSGAPSCAGGRNTCE